jgi:hypothetical protein
MLKLACISYTSSPIPYREKNYHVSELLKIKAGVIADCQRVLRENIYKTAHRDGATIRQRRDEEAFVIEPLLDAQTTDQR